MFKPVILIFSTDIPVRLRILLIRSQFVMDKIEMDRMDRINGS